jgi:CheY-like chemotaxis protein/CRP-like cAMP-binding protein
MHQLLVIEDNTEVRENIAEILELAGYFVHTAANGKQGIEQVKANKPDLIICDIMMPVMDGYEVLHLLSKNAATATIPFIFLTAKAERNELRKGMEMGADDYITKPFDKIELLNAIESRLKKVSAIRKEYETNLDGLTDFIGDVVGKDAMRTFLDGKKNETFSKKESIYKEGGVPRGIYYIQSGKVKIFRTHERGKELITALLKDGDFFGYTALLEGKDYTEMAQAMEDSVIAFIPKDEFFKLVYNNKEIAKKFLYLLTKNVTEQQAQLLDLAYSSVRKRVADSLLLLQERYKKENQQQLILTISREDLANIVGTASETLIRTLSDFKDEKLIEIQTGKIKVINEKKLKEMRN